ncbi:hydroxyacyl-thioester dehydratase type 2, mitochondrial [Phlebotomus papatasi]|uniref:hydroxyacyl-thioester dehydratase type 2, mitochondrial n=1 Tax=Phlebotomus papatasi TaxID=29031 RepID=UPI0024842945|nr:hydroxyacyl-thioester dehydratase type 2, mitochondrial [Phlebotomus papatasi]
MMLARVQNILRAMESSRSFTTVAAHVKKGDILEVTRRISQGDVDRFTRVIGDKNPIHSSDQPPEHRLIPGSLLNGIVSGLVGSQLPGPGSILVSQKLSFPHKCVVDKDINIRIEVADLRKIITVTYECYQDKKIVFKGEANLMHKEV